MTCLLVDDVDRLGEFGAMGDYPATCISLEVMLSFQNVRGAFANDHAGSHRVAGYDTRHD